VGLTNPISRETWLDYAVDKLRPHYDAKGFPLADRMKIAMGFPSRRALSDNPAKGEVWFDTEDGTTQIFINPLEKGSKNVVSILAVQLLRSALPDEISKSDYREAAEKMDIVGTVKDAVPGMAFAAFLDGITEELEAKYGPLPHAAIVPKEKVKKESKNRQLKAVCPKDVRCQNPELAEKNGFKVRLAKGCAETFGMPYCPCSNQMVFEEEEGK
jgi:hypothetical protein